MILEAEVQIKTTVCIDDTDGRLCGSGCQFRRSASGSFKCVLYREETPQGRRCASCVRDVRLPQHQGDAPEYRHLSGLVYAQHLRHKEGRLFELAQLRDIVAEPVLDRAARERLARKWKEAGIKPARSFCAADCDVEGYGPTDSSGFFAYPC